MVLDGSYHDFILIYLFESAARLGAADSTPSPAPAR